MGKVLYPFSAVSPVKKGEIGIPGNVVGVFPQVVVFSLFPCHDDGKGEVFFFFPCGDIYCNGDPPCDTSKA